jgi:hypothetical protein
MSQLTAQRVISGDPEALAALANIHMDKISIPPLPQPLLASARPTSSSNSASALSVDTTDTDTLGSSSVDGRDSQEGPGGPWRELHPRPPTSLSETTAATSVQSEPDSQSSCCCAPPGESKGDEADYDVKPPRYLGNPQNPVVTSSLQVSGLTQPMDPVSNRNQFGINHPDDLAQLNTDFGTYELSAGCGMAEDAGGGSMPEPQHSQAACECGDSCECFACMQHPKNRTTLGYVRYHNDLFMREAQVPQLGFGDSQVNYQLTTHVQYTQQFAAPFGPAPVIGDQSVPWPDAPNQFAHEQFQFQPRPEALASNPEAAYMSPGRPFTPAYAQEPAPAPSSPAAALEPMQQQQQTQPQRHQQTAGSATAAGDADAHADDSGYSPTLSPSAFMLHQYTLPGCDNFYGTCLCGDGCACDGCLTHSGHDGYAASAAPSEAAMNGTGGAAGANGWGVYADHGGAGHQGAITPG